MQPSEDIYGLNNLGLPEPSILRQIQTCKHPKQLEWVVKNLVLEAENPSARAMKRWKRAIAYMQVQLGVQVMIQGEPAID
jgi:hypothetical protein